MFVFAPSCVNMLHHILGFERDAFTLTGRDQLGTINERLYMIFPGTRHYKRCVNWQMEGKLAQEKRQQ